MRNTSGKPSGIKAWIEKSGHDFYGFTLSGHAGYAERGRDIVCAAVSMSAIQFVNSVEALTTSQASLDNDDGFLRFYIQSNTPEAQLLFRSFVLGLEMIQKEYGKEFIHIEYKEV